MPKIGHFALALLILSCTKDKATEQFPRECSTIEISYASDISPIIKTSCTTGTGPGTGCHDAWILTYDGIRPRAINGDIRRVIYDLGTMPPDSNFLSIPKLDENEIDIVLCWIDQGAPNN